MRTTLTFSALVLASFLASGCRNGNGVPVVSNTQGQTANARQSETKVQNSHPMDAIAEYTFSQRQEFIASMRKDLDETQSELSQLTARVNKADGAVKADANIRLDTARGKWMRAKDELKRAEEATAMTWDQVKANFKSAYGEMHDQVSMTRQWLSEKIAP